MSSQVPVFIILLSFITKSHHLISSSFLLYGHLQEPTSGQLQINRSVVSFMHCGALCIKNENCVGVGYSDVLHECQLLGSVSEGQLSNSAFYSVWVNKITCQDSPCKNGATCHDSPAGLYTCYCAFNFTGYHCEIPPKGYYYYLNGSSFKLYKTQKTQSQAISACESDGARLAKVPDLATHQFLMSLISSPADTWIDLRKVNGEWQYAGEFRGWVPPEPYGDGDCAYMATNYLMGWNDYVCTKLCYYICEIKIQ
ncbi:aggrecan core protein-like [Tachypleus tridentatus]|uniref:aggrecan core protein-like n=1 Tax=Tachypleus tridentatus TaxID=6853 RepID=UPI003FD29EF1